MKTVKLGHTNEQVSEYALGTMYMGSKITGSVSQAILDCYMDAGGNFIDTANNYAHWVEGCHGTESESFLGQWFAKTGKRGKVFLATKVGFDKKGVGKGLKARQIIENCETSLRLLQTDYIDLYYAHTDDRTTPLDESMEAFESLRKAGKIRYLGASNYTPWRFADAQRICDDRGYITFCCLQNRFTYLRPAPRVLDRFHIDIDDNVMDFAVDRDTTLLAYSPLLQGFYTDITRQVPALYAGSHNDKRLEALKQVAAEAGNVSLNCLVFAWMRAQNARIIPLLSGNTVEQVADNLKAGEINLTAGQLEHLNNA